MLAGPLLLAACGGGTIGQPAPCATLSPAPTPRPGPFGGGRFQDYLLAIRPQLDRLQSLENQFLLDHTSHAFSTDSAFRPAVASFIDQLVCAATALQAISPPNAPQFQQAATDEQTALAAYISHLLAGRKAVVTRNVTDYRTFYDSLQTKFDAVQKAYQNPLR